ncbi:hypothetical protein [Rickettsia endosymbiont of Halotydeus destructor]|uniref:hypothetical protein n=1 Tax=Rickettsia endosymbiont of Halotydeus destructor TaxID=2996754 RepID=UPI003BB2043D
MKQKIYELKSDPQSCFSIGIACRNQNDPITGVFVNTDPSNSIMCRESEFQARKFELLIKEKRGNEILDIANDYSKKQRYPLLEFKSAQNVVEYIRNLKESEASTFTRASGLNKLNPGGWIGREKHNIMADIQKDFIRDGGERGKQYATTALAMVNLGIGIIESSSKDGYWGIIAKYVNESGKGENELGTIHTIIGKELQVAAKNALGDKFTYNGREIDLKDVEEKHKEIEKAISDKKLNMMNIKYNNDKTYTIEASPITYSKKQQQVKEHSVVQQHSKGNNVSPPSSTPNYLATTQSKRHARW